MGENRQERLQMSESFHFYSLRQTAITNLLRMTLRTLWWGHFGVNLSHMISFKHPTWERRMIKIVTVATWQNVKILSWILQLTLFSTISSACLSSDLRHICHHKVTLFVNK